MRGAVGAAFSVGPGYEPQPPYAAARVDAVDGYYLDLRRKAVAALRPRITGRGEVWQPGHTAAAQQALGLHQWWLSGDESARDRIGSALEELRARAEQRDGALLWRYDLDVPKYRLRGPWYSAMAQGQATSAFVRGYRATGAEEWAVAASAAARGLTHAGERLGLLTTTPQGIVLQESPTTPPSHTLNGWVFALWGLWDVSVGLGEPEARALFTNSSAALARMLDSFDVGWWTRYSLFPPLSPDLAKPFYHAIHTAQMPWMYEMTNDPVFLAAARRWRSYDRVWNRSRAIAAKTVTVIASLRAPKAA